jgi:hypothetical protein
MTATCINLQQRFGRRYRVVYEESYHAQYGHNARTEDPWLQIISCLHGHICLWGDDKLAACTDKAGPVAKALKALAFTQTAQDGDDGANIVFPVEHFDEVAAIMKPRRRRRLSEEQKAKVLRNLIPFPKKAAKHVAGASPSERHCVRKPKVDI